MLRRRLMKNGGIPEGAINGKFSVSADKLVYFSKGNLLLTGENAWLFADNQWERFGKSQLSDNHRDMFGWGTGNNPNQTSSNNSDYGTFTDWGSNAISNGGNEAGLWRTLSKDEWMYVFGINNGDKRLGATVGGTSNARWANATINTDGTGVNGAILFPDSATFAAGEATWGTINAYSNWGTKCTTAQWTALENKGCVFLPAAGMIVGSSAYDFDSAGTYWSSTAGESNRAYNTQFRSNRSPSVSDGYRYIRITVRLVYDIKAKESKFVDLGLPSGTKWARMNIGATSETDYGNYYMYGMGSKTYDSTDTPYAGTEDPLNSSVDTATQVWGSLWHMPTRAQIQELIDNTTYQWVTNYKGSGINGGTFTATNGAVLFLPAAGYYLYTGLAYAGESCYYWSSSPDDSSFSYYLYCDSYNSHKSVTFGDRTYGHSVRPVIG